MYIQFESYDTYLLYQEFQNIPGNTVDFEVPKDLIVTSRMMHVLLWSAYHASGVDMIMSQ